MPEKPLLTKEMIEKKKKQTRYESKYVVRKRERKRERERKNGNIQSKHPEKVLQKTVRKRDTRI